MKYYKYLSLIIILIISACTNESKKEIHKDKTSEFTIKTYSGNGFLVHGYTQNNSDSIYLKNENGVIIASTVPNKKGYFFITGNQQDTIPTLLKSRNTAINILLCNDEIFITKTTGLQHEFQKEYSTFKNGFNSISKLDKKLARKIRKTILNDWNAVKYREKLAKQQYKEIVFLKDYIKNNPKSYSALIALDELELRADLSLDAYKKIKSGFATNLLNTTIAQNLEKHFTEKEEKLTIQKVNTNKEKTKTTRVIKTSKSIAEDRAKAYYLEGTSINGYKVTLPAVVRKSKLVYLDFWASWCGPCRMQNPVLKSIYRKYHAQGLEIISISADTDESAWRNAVNIDGLPWINILDTNKKIASRYYVQNLPFGVLIDRNGMVISDFVSAGKLQNLVPRYINEK